MHRIDIAPPNSLVLVMDPSVGEVPEIMAGGSIAASRSCVAVGTLCEVDGSTRISLGATNSGLEGHRLAFDGVLETPGRRIAVMSVTDEVLIQMPVESDQTRVRVWTNDDREPSDIDIEASTWDA
jgi:hypothetical protein